MIARRSLILVTGFASLPIPRAFAQAYPSKPIRIVVPTGSGTGTDLTARHIAVGLQKAWGQAVIVDNKVGAGGVIGTDAVAPRSTPPQIVAKLSDVVLGLATTTPDFKDFCIAQGLEVDVQDAAVFKASAPAELAKWKRLVELTAQKGS